MRCKELIPASASVVLLLIVAVAGEGGASEADPSTTNTPAAPDPAGLVAGFASEPVSSLYYTTFPDGFQQLTAMGNAAVPALLEGLQHADGNVRFTSLAALNQTTFDSERREVVVRAMADAAQDSSDWVRTEAVYGLGILRARSEVATLVAALEDRSTTVVQEALVALDKVHHGVLLKRQSSLNLNDSRVEELKMEWHVYMTAKHDGLDAVPPWIFPPGASFEFTVDPDTDVGGEVAVRLPPLLHPVPPEAVADDRTMPSMAELLEAFIESLGLPSTPAHRGRSSASRGP